MLECNNTEKGSLFIEGHILCGLCLGCQHSMIQEKRVVFFKLMKKFMIRVCFLIITNLVHRICMYIHSPNTRIKWQKWGILWLFCSVI